VGRRELTNRGGWYPEWWGGGPNVCRNGRKERKKLPVQREKKGGGSIEKKNWLLRSGEKTQKAGGKWDFLFERKAITQKKKGGPMVKKKNYIQGGGEYDRRTFTEKWVNLNLLPKKCKERDSPN